MLMLTAAPASAEAGLGKIEEGVPAANRKTGTSGMLIDPNFQAVLVATGTDPLENPSRKIVRFGYLSDGVPTEPDENTHLVLDTGRSRQCFRLWPQVSLPGPRVRWGSRLCPRINLDVPRPTQDYAADPGRIQVWPHGI
jgi:hypothetical protein